MKYAMTYSIINTENDCVVSAHPTAEQAEAEMHEMTHVSEYMDGRTEIKATTAIYKYRVRNDDTGDWIEYDR